MYQNVAQCMNAIIWRLGRATPCWQTFIDLYSKNTLRTFSASKRQKIKNIEPESEKQYSSLKKKSVSVSINNGLRPLVADCRRWSRRLHRENQAFAKPRSSLHPVKLSTHCFSRSCNPLYTVLPLNRSLTENKLPHWNDSANEDLLTLLCILAYVPERPVLASCLSEVVNKLSL